MSDSRASADLHAADARYHDDCRLKFMGSKNILCASTHHEKQDDLIDEALKQVIKDLQLNQSKMWTSVEIHQYYCDIGGNILSRRSLINELSTHFGTSLLVLSSPGIASILLFRGKASSIFRIDDIDEDEADIKKVAKVIEKEIKQIPVNKNLYEKRINKEIALKDVSETLSQLLSSISSKLSNNSLPSILIGNIVTSVYSRRATNLLIDLGLLVREKKVIESLYDFGVVCSYDEIKRFKASAALEGDSQKSESLLQDHSVGGLTQAVADNFDAIISSQNGKKQTHALALLLTQPRKKEDKSHENETFKRIKKSDIKDSEIKDVKTHIYMGPKMVKVLEG